MMEKLEKLVPYLAWVFGKEGVEDWKKKVWHHSRLRARIFRIYND